MLIYRLRVLEHLGEGVMQWDDTYYECCSDAHHIAQKGADEAFDRWDTVQQERSTLYTSLGHTEKWYIVDVIEPLTHEEVESIKAVDQGRELWTEFQRHEAAEIAHFNGFIQQLSI